MLQMPEYEVQSVVVKPREELVDTIPLRVGAWCAPGDRFMVTKGIVNPTDFFPDYLKRIAPNYPSLKFYAETYPKDRAAGSGDFLGVLAISTNTTTSVFFVAADFLSPPPGHPRTDNVGANGLRKEWGRKKCVEMFAPWVRSGVNQLRGELKGYYENNWYVPGDVSYHYEVADLTKPLREMLDLAVPPDWQFSRERSWEYGGIFSIAVLGYAHNGNLKTFQMATSAADLQAKAQYVLSNVESDQHISTTNHQLSVIKVVEQYIGERRITPEEGYTKKLAAIPAYSYIFPEREMTSRGDWIREVLNMHQLGFGQVENVLFNGNCCQFANCRPIRSLTGLYMFSDGAINDVVSDKFPLHLSVLQGGCQQDAMAMGRLSTSDFLDTERLLGSNWPEIASVYADREQGFSQSRLDDATRIVVTE